MHEKGAARVVLDLPYALVRVPPSDTPGPHRTAVAFPFTFVFPFTVAFPFTFIICKLHWINEWFIINNQ